ncbi:hypothetical protein AC094_34740 [Bacteroides fragilis]|uniref:Uncharacterized protein n=1 Tax=Bacteroides fragilis TaxID=817 RepID=A0A853PR48_BACFG|nr:hypothetical protein AC094_34740 [Bacteroides fragilis]
MNIKDNIPGKSRNLVSPIIIDILSCFFNYRLKAAVYPNGD